MTDVKTNIKAVTLAAELTDNLVSVHGELKHQPSPTSVADAVEQVVLAGAAVCQLGLRGAVGDPPEDAEGSFQGALHLYCIAIARTLAVLNDAPDDDGARRALGELYAGALADVDNRAGLLRCDLDEYTVEVSALRAGAWTPELLTMVSGSQAGNALEDSAGKPSLRGYLNTIGSSALIALAGSLYRQGLDEIGS